MTLIATWTSSGSSLTPTTMSLFTAGSIFVGAAIAIGTVSFLLALNALASTRDSWNPRTAMALRAIYLPLLVTFFVFVVVATAQIL
jgi:hypothetical protein